MKNMTFKMLLTCLALFLAIVAFSQTASTSNSKTKKTETSTMKTYVIEREIPGAGKFTGEELKGISQKSCSVLQELGPGIEWVQSYVTQDKLYCIYRAQNEEILRIHAEKGGFPINRISLLSTMISPATAELASAK